MAKRSQRDQKAPARNITRSGVASNQGKPAGRNAIKPSRPDRGEQHARGVHRLIDEVLAFNATTIDLLFRMSKSAEERCCKDPFEDIAILRTALRTLTNTALSVQVEDLGGEGMVSLWRIFETMSELQLPQIDSTPSYTLPLRVGIDSLLLAKSGNDGILFAALPGLPIPDSLDPQDFAKIIDKVIELLKAWLQAARDEGSASLYEIEQEIQALIEEWERMRETILASGYRIDVKWAFDLVKDVLVKAIQIFRQYGLTGPFAVALRSQLTAFLAQIRALIAGELGGATVGFAIRMGLYALAFYIGHLIGKWIGKQQVDGKTVNDWLADGIYYEYFAISDDCLDAEAAYYAAAKARRDYENSGPTLDKSVMLALLSKEYAALFTLRETGVRKRCFDDVSVFDKELERLKQRYQKLAGH
jgi:hypothetical protein